MAVIMSERLHKWLAAAGIASRRECEEMILDGRVTVNGRLADRLPVLIDPQRDDVRVDGRRIHAQRKVYFLLNKPRGVVCTNRDPAGRKRAVDLLVGVRERVFPVGRLDADSTGLLLLTNDGELALRLAHPRYGVEKTYRAEIRHAVPPGDLEKLRRGIWLSTGRARHGDAPASRAQATRVTVVYRSRQETALEIVLREGRNRQVRRMLAALGHPVRRLRRTQIGQLCIRGLGVGRFRPLTPAEVRYLQQIGAKAEGGSNDSAMPRRAGPVGKRRSSPGPSRRR
jgi:23S rRNA pseudouridine2605 synthase